MFVILLEELEWGIYMTEKRFHQFGLWVIDNPNFNGVNIADLVDTELMSITEVVDKLNKQQSTISQLERKLELKTEEVEYLKRMMVKWGMVKDE